MGTKNLLDRALRCNARVVLANSPGAPPVSREQPPPAPWHDRLRRKRKRSTDATDAGAPAAKRRRIPKRSVPSTGRSFYDEGNRLAEMLCAAYEQHFGLDIRIAHLPDPHHPISTPHDGDGRVLHLRAPTNEAVLDSADTTLLDTDGDDGVLRGLIDLMEAPGLGKAASRSADPAATPAVLP